MTEYKELLFVWENHCCGWIVLIQSFTSWILFQFSIISWLGPLTDSGTLFYQVFFYIKKYSMEVWTWYVSDGFIEEVESRISSDHDQWYECENSDSVRDKISGSQKNQISTDCSSFVYFKNYQQLIVLHIFWQGMPS